MTELRTLLQTALVAIHPKVYYQVAPEDAVFPYLIYDVPTFNDFGEWNNHATIDVDCWDLPSLGDTSALESLASDVRAGLNKLCLTGSTISAVLFLESRMTVEEEDKRLKRIKLLFGAKVFERGI